MHVSNLDSLPYLNIPKHILLKTLGIYMLSTRQTNNYFCDFVIILHVCYIVDFPSWLYSSTCVVRFKSSTNTTYFTAFVLP